jgi:hypothetical protein
VKRPDCSKQTYLHLETPTFHEQFKENLTQFSQENKLLHVLSSNIEGFLSRDTYVSLTQLNWHIWGKQNYLHLETLKLQEEFLLKTNSVLTGKQCA